MGAISNFCFPTSCANINLCSALVQKNYGDWVRVDFKYTQKIYGTLLRFLDNDVVHVIEGDSGLPLLGAWWPPSRDP